jgi:hypothetical protein
MAFEDGAPQHLQARQFLKVHTDITGVWFALDRREVISIPADSLLQLVTHPSAEDKRMAHVTWDGRAVLIFENDLVERTTAVRPPGRTRAARKRRESKE